MADTSKSEEEKKQQPGLVVDPAIKHPLQRSWTLWYDTAVRKHSNDRSNLSQNWEENLNQVLTVSTVEDFWGLVNNIEAAGNLSPGSNYHFFEAGIRPAWEDKANARGGKWVAVFRKRSVDIDKKWIFTLLACIGESFPAAEQICGVVVSLRNNPGDRISLWTSSADDRENTMAIGQYFKGKVLETEVKVTYQSHEQSQKNRHSSRYDV
eukprot:CAMPEP_0201489070 /NCGR_PEP_ID=MMETSP0151_2-20130828/21004_1 /ASSEMBLY_ACC=CAM_ASM_000257 /TAXON_ID=200890 /ORGANISM="Paramoeba atlantica, Strain 621/1 / CCAP 1560/9" /LENGTH=208 /DNA_ID=CAMNT_0047874541 /DNA_START=126 /DNA_END=752 /DNA_ORIENTATION=-